jgi:hypothetical protein
MCLRYLYGRFIGGTSVNAPYFCQEDLLSLQQPTPQPLQGIYEKFTELHNSLRRRMRDHNWDLHAHWDRAQMISARSAACGSRITGLTLPYFRSRDQAQLVERLMGRDGVGFHSSIDTHRHPVIELRLTPEHFAIELIVSPSSWWDQRNLIGKLSVTRHRDALRGLLQRMDGDYRFGFWDGIHLSDMHLTNRQLLRGSILDEWMSTFSDGQDWLRVGVWYATDDPMLEAPQIVSEIVGRVGALYTVYNFLLWTSNNNFQTFYKGTSFKPSHGRDTRL